MRLVVLCCGLPLATAVSVYGQGKEGTTAREDRRATLTFCTAVGTAQSQELYAVRGRGDFTVIVFDDSGPCYLSRQVGTEGDPIAIGFVAVRDANVSLDLDPCTTLAAVPKVLISAETSFPKLLSEEPTAPEVRWFQPLRQCFGTAAGIKVTLDRDGKPVPLAYTLQQYERYRATLQIGVTASKLHQRGFALRPSGTTTHIFETSADGRGPEYIASVVVYGVPHYFLRRTVRMPRFIEGIEGTSNEGTPADPRAVRRESYFGRDPVNDNSISDRIGLMFGAGMNQPGRRFVLGGSFELLTGVNALVAREFVRTPELEGFEVGDEFTGAASAIPLRDHWRTAWTVGISLDARYALALFGRK